MKIFAEVLPDSLGRAMYRINKNLRKFAPDWVEFTKDKDEADFQILDVIGLGSLDFLYNDNYAILQHCFLSSENSSNDVWLPIFNNAKLVATYMDLPSITKSDSFNFHRMPWGVDPSTFYKTDHQKIYTVLTTGHVSLTESIDEIYNACQVTGGNLIHIGHDFKLGNRFEHLENISDEELINVYSQTKYVSGLRKMEGFELPILEGLLCGTRGICYNKDHYRYWYGDLVEYIEEDPGAFHGFYSEQVKDQLIDLFNSPYRAVTDNEIGLVKERFSWEKIMKEFWRRLETVL